MSETYRVKRLVFKLEKKSAISSATHKSKFKNDFHDESAAVSCVIL